MPISIFLGSAFVIMLFAHYVKITGFQMNNLAQGFRNVTHPLYFVGKWNVSLKIHFLFSDISTNARFT